MSCRILIAETETILSDLLGDHLRRTIPESKIQVVRTAEELNELRQEDFDLAVVDVALADGDAIGWLKSGTVYRPYKHVLVLTSCEKDVPLHNVLSTGVRGLIHKADGLAFFDIALKTVLAGGSVISPKIQEIRAKCLSAPTFFAKLLSPREQAILQALGARQSVPEISKSLGIKRATVVDHRKNIMKKLGLHSQVELVAYSIDKGFAPLVKRRHRATSR